MHRCMLRSGIGSTGAEEFHWSTQTSSLEQSTFNAPLLDSKASVQPVLKTSWGPPKHALWNKVHLMHRCFAWYHRFNWWYRMIWFQLASKRERPTGRRNFRQASDAPMLGASVKPVLLFFFVFNWIDLDLNVTSIVSSSKRCVNFYWPSWAVFWASVQDF